MHQLRLIDYIPERIAVKSYLQKVKTHTIPVNKRENYVKNASQWFIFSVFCHFWN